MRPRALSRREAAFHRGDLRGVANTVNFVFDRFLLLPLGALIALAWANTASESYFTFSYRLSFLVNEVAMAFFFGLLAQEVIEATMPGGSLHTWRRWSTALVAAAGGILGASAVYLLWIGAAYEELLRPAWPVACAIDAAAAYYVLKILLPRSGVLPFVLLLAIATDIFGAVVVGFRGAATTLQAGGIGLLAMALVIAASMRIVRVTNFWAYLVPAAISWAAFYMQGVHPALAFVPIVPFLPHEPRRLELFIDRDDPKDAVHHYEHEWNVLVQLVLFMFALVNAGVLLRHYDTGTWAIIVAALVGRPVGIGLAVAIAVALGLHLPPRVGWRHIVVVALATSSGFTFALFFATGLFPLGPTLTQIKMGALSTAAGAILAFGAARLLRVGSRFR